MDTKAMFSIRRAASSPTVAEQERHGRRGVRGGIALAACSRRRGAPHAVAPPAGEPITERTDFRLSYSHEVQTPDFNTLLRANNDLSFTNTNDFSAAT
jgi:hypothetical protein